MVGVLVLKLCFFPPSAPLQLTDLRFDVDATENEELLNVWLRQVPYGEKKKKKKEL